jgi:hypothetical protein
MEQEGWWIMVMGYGTSGGGFCGFWGLRCIVLHLLCVVCWVSGFRLCWLGHVCLDWVLSLGIAVLGVRICNERVVGRMCVRLGNSVFE